MFAQLRFAFFKFFSNGYQMCRDIEIDSEVRLCDLTCLHLSLLAPWNSNHNLLCETQNLVIQVEGGKKRNKE